MTAALAIGFFYELLWVGWTRSVLGKNPWHAAGLTMLLGAFGLAGLTEGLRDLPHAACLILGYGCGSFAAVRWWR